MDLPFHLKTLQPLKGALDILRYFGTIDSDTADADEICDVLNLSDRGFNKAMRRLVTKGYVSMDDDMYYRLTDQGETSVEELNAYDEATGGGLSSGGASRPASPAPRAMTRRMVIAVPNQLVAGQPAQVVVGFSPAQMPGSTEMVVRLSVVNGEPQTPEDALFSLTSDAAHQTLEVKPGRYNKVRIKLEAVQLGPNPSDFNSAGGMYVDIPVLASGANGTELAAYGTDISISL